MKMIKIVDKNGTVFWVKSAIIILMLVKTLPLGAKEWNTVVRIRMSDSIREYFEDYSVADEKAGELLMQSIADQINSLCN